MVRAMTAAVEHHQAGRLAEADRQYRQVLKIVPDQPDALHLCGLVACQQGRFRDAVPLIEKAISLNPDVAEFHVHLGNAYKELDEPAAAQTQYLAALRIAPGIPQTYNNLGTVYFTQGKDDAATEAYRKALQIEPRFFEAHLNLARVLTKQRDYEEAVEHFRAAITIAPQSGDAVSGLGELLLKLGRGAQAAKYFETALALHADPVRTRLGLAEALTQSGRPNVAMRYIDEAWALEPGSVAVLRARAGALKALGEHAEAESRIRQALELEPDSPALYAELATMRKFSGSEPEVARMEALAQEREAGGESVIGLHFALGKIYADVRDYARSFSHYAAGNRSERATFDYDPQSTTSFVDRSIQILKRELFVQHRRLGLDTELPVFIVGMPRSGTTLTEQILSSHPQVAGAGELGDVGRMAAALPAFLNTQSEYPECVRQLNAEVAQRFGSRYLAELRSFSAAALRATDKMPGNFNYLGLIALLFPNARIVHCRRDPVDTCLSIYFQKFGGYHPYAYDLRELGLYYLEYERLMAHWHQTLPMPIFTVQYEDMVAEPESTSRQLVAFCGLEWDDACLRFHESKRAVQTASHWQVRQPIYRTSAGRWKRYEAFLGPLIEALGGAGSAGEELASDGSES